MGVGANPYSGVTVAPNLDVYVCIYGGDLAIQPGGVGTFTFLSQTFRNYNGMAVNPVTGDVYVAVRAGDIYMRVSGAGNLVALGQAALAWYAMGCSTQGRVLALVNGVDLYSQLFPLFSGIKLPQS